MMYIGKIEINLKELWPVAWSQAYVKIFYIFDSWVNNFDSSYTKIIGWRVLPQRKAPAKIEMNPKRIAVSSSRKAPTTFKRNPKRIVASRLITRFVYGRGQRGKFVFLHFWRKFEK